ncbi:C39 family peptidase [Levilactobacillus zymae]|uniref:C39 family peptidase n=1 Tax=Levilactobacillus zymae TaxID=267363 RepID=UPI0028BCF0DA|nr:C39 family peptidase [Levilactobacillus zymae]MDT6980930.1 C39 family peptidase [Levilactobacillus zymae]
MNQLAKQHKTWAKFGWGIIGGLLGWGLMMSGAAAQSVGSLGPTHQVNYGRTLKRVSGQLYQVSAGKLQPQRSLRGFNRTLWVVSKTATVTTAAGKTSTYDYVTAAGPAKRTTVKGWIRQQDLTHPTRVALNAPYISQQAVKAWMGCESAALLEGLHYKGVKVHTGLVAFMKQLPRSKTNNPNNGFAGSPYRVTPGVFQSIFPKPLAKWGNRYHRVTNISGTSAAGLRAQLRLNRPVVVYVTLHFAKAQWGHYFWGKGINNSHVMLLDGYNTKTHQYHVADPNQGKYWVSAQKFSRSYNYRHYAVAID